MGKSVRELREEAKELVLRGYSTLSKDQLTQLLSGEIVKKNLKKNQKCEETETEFKQCEECSLNRVLHQLTLKAERRIVEEDGVRIDVDTGEVLGLTVERSYIYIYKLNL